jgi:hypothetical protein
VSDGRDQPGPRRPRDGHVRRPALAPRSSGNSRENLKPPKIGEIRRCAKWHTSVSVVPAKSLVFRPNPSGFAVGIGGRTYRARCYRSDAIDGRIRNSWRLSPKCGKFRKFFRSPENHASSVPAPARSSRPLSSPVVPTLSPLQPFRPPLPTTRPSPPLPPIPGHGFPRSHGAALRGGLGDRPWEPAAKISARSRN